MNFGSYLKARRIELGYTLRQFASAKGLDAAYLSRMENGIMSAPADKDKIKAIAIALAIEPNSTEWVEFFDLASASRNEIPQDLRDNPIVPRLLPAFFRTLRNGQLTEAEIRKLESLLLGGITDVPSSGTKPHSNPLS